MEVILRADVPKLGHRGEVVKVAEGYARNYLLPKRLAVAATTGNKKVVEQEKNAAVRREATERGSAEELARQLANVSVVIRRKAGESDHLFGSVTSIDVADALESKGFHIDRRKIQLDDPIKDLGEYLVSLKLHRDVNASIKVNVERES